MNRPSQKPSQEYMGEHMNTSNCLDQIYIYILRCNFFIVEARQNHPAKASGGFVKGGRPTEPGYQQVQASRFQSVSSSFVIIPQHRSYPGMAGRAVKAKAAAKPKAAPSESKKRKAKIQPKIETDDEEASAATEKKSTRKKKSKRSKKSKKSKN